jgi:septal ring factor EnvC (AmiA/AmiB activator)
MATLEIISRTHREKRYEYKVVNAVDIAVNRLPHMESLYKQAKDQAEKIQCTIQRLANYIEERKTKISILDKIVFSSEQECRRTEQQLQGLTDKKDIIFSHLEHRLTFHRHRHHPSFAALLLLGNYQIRIAIPVD